MLLEPLVEHRAAVGGRVVLRQRGTPAGALVVVGEAGDAVHGVHAGLGTLQRVGIDVGGVDQAAFEQAFFMQQDGEGIDLFAGAAARHPDLERRVGAQQRYHGVAQGLEVARVAEHLADLHGHVVEQGGEGGRIVQHLVLQLRQGCAAELVHRGLEPALERRARVGAEVVVVLQVDGIEQQLELDVGILGRDHVGHPFSALLRHPHAHER